ncbi:arsenite methyltransferase [Chloroflexota bacterium]
MKDEVIRDAVKSAYAEIAGQGGRSCCSCSSCGDVTAEAEAAGYSAEELSTIPQEAVMGLGCGNPTAVGELKEGEVVLDLGSGAGVDVFLAAGRVGPRGRAIGLDMTEEMVQKAREIAAAGGYENVEFRLGEMEGMPVEDGSVDVIISNCVINLSTDKAAVFGEAYRVLRPGGRLVVSDIVSQRSLPPEIRDDLDAWAACAAGALERGEYLDMIRDAGFGRVEVESERERNVELGGCGCMEKLLSITVKAYK